MKNYLKSLLNMIKKEETQAEEEGRELVERVHAAKDGWIAAQSYFESVSDPDLVDYAIYELEAARRKYMYFLKLARAEGLADTRIFDDNNQAVM